MRHITKVLGIELAPYEEGQLVFSMKRGAGVITKIHYDAEGITYMEVVFFYGIIGIVKDTLKLHYGDNGMPYWTDKMNLEELLIPESSLALLGEKVPKVRSAMYSWKDSFDVVRNNEKAIMEEFHIKKENQEDLTNPSYYNVEGASQPIEDMEALMTPEQFEGFLWGNIIKYSKRFGRKGDKILTLGKIIWYADRLKTHLEKESDVNGHD
jgi:hypothetical protein